MRGTWQGPSLQVIRIAATVASRGIVNNKFTTGLAHTFNRWFMPRKPVNNASNPTLKSEEKKFCFWYVFSALPLRNMRKAVEILNLASDFSQPSNPVSATAQCYSLQASAPRLPSARCLLLAYFMLDPISLPKWHPRTNWWVGPPCCSVDMAPPRLDRLRQATGELSKC